VRVSQAFVREDRNQEVFTEIASDYRDARVHAAAKLLSGLGSELDVKKTPTGYALCGYACPLASAVRGEPRACHAVEELISAVVGQPVSERCDRTSAPRCRFDVIARSA